MTETSRPALLRELGAELKAARLRAGLGVRELGREAGISSHSRVSEAESGKRLLLKEELESILETLDVPPGDRERFHSMARSAAGPGKLNAGIPGISETLTDLIGYESAALSVTDGAFGLLPGLLQSNDYAREVTKGRANADLRVTLRAGRREILRRPVNPVRYTAYIDSEALIRPVVPPEKMRHQLRQILDVAKLPNVTIRVVSSTLTGYNPLLAGAFELLEFSKATPVVLLDHHSSSVFLWDSNDVDGYIEAVKRLQKIAMTATQSVAVIRKIVEGMERP